MLLNELLKCKINPSKVIFDSKWGLTNQDKLSSLRNSEKYEIPKYIFSALSTLKLDKGVIAVVNSKHLPRSLIKNSFVVILDNVQDPGNVGNIFRTSLAGDVDLILLIESANPLNHKVLRSSAGSVFKLPYERFKDFDLFEESLILKKLQDSQNNGFQIIGTAIYEELNKSKVKYYWDINWLKPTILLLGNEGSGISSRLKKICSYFVTIPHNTLVESLNVSSACVPLILERTRIQKEISSKEKN